MREDVAFDRRRAIILASALLWPSETFIREQSLALRRWKPVLVGERRLETGLPLYGLEHRVLLEEPVSVLRRVGYTVRKWAGRTDNESARILREISASIVHAHFGTTAVDFWPTVETLDIPLLVTLHGYDVNIDRQWWKDGHGGLRRRWYPSLLERLANNKSVHFIAVSDALKHRAIARGIPQNRIETHRIGVDLQRFRPDGPPMEARPLRVLFVGRLVEKKGLRHLLSAFAAVKRAIKNAELVVIGDGPDLDRLRRLDGDLLVHAHFVGHLSHEQICVEMNSARLLCVPSVVAANGDAEGLPTVIAEAQAKGLPVVTSLDAGCAEAVTKESGRSVAVEDSGALAEAIIDLLVDTDRLEEMAKFSRRNAEKHFDIVRQTSRLEEIYQERVDAHLRQRGL